MVRMCVRNIQGLFCAVIVVFCQSGSYTLLTSITCMPFGTAEDSDYSQICVLHYNVKPGRDISSYNDSVVHALWLVVNAVELMSMSKSASGHIHLFPLTQPHRIECEFMHMHVNHSLRCEKEV